MQESSTRSQKARKNVTVNLYQFPKHLESLMEKAVRATFAAENPVVSGEVNIILISDQEIKKLNRKYRKVNRITDVISFRFSPDPVTGDIYISEGRSKKQAKAQGHGWEKELTYLTVHGILHLFNYTDYTPKARATMFRKQDAIWAGLFK